MESGPDPVADIKSIAPPAGDLFVYLDFLRLVLITRKPTPDLRSQLLAALNDALKDVDVANAVGWEAMPLLLEVPGSDDCLITIARLANPREVIIGALQGLRQLDLYDIEDDWHGEESVVGEEKEPSAPNDLDRFCFLLSLLSILHPRIKTKHPSRILASTVLAIMQAFHPSHRAVMAIGKFAHIVSGKKRPTLPGRKSSLGITSVMRPEIESNLPSAPDPEAQEEDIYESDIQKKLLQGLVTHMLEMYINVYPLEWAGRLQESFDPKRVVAGRTSLAEAFQTTPELQTRETVAGQLVSLSRDLGLANYDLLFDTIHSKEPIAHAPNPEDNLPDSPDDIPLSPVGCLFLLTSLIFSSVMFKTKTPEPVMAIFPDHAKLVARLFESADGSSIAIVDAVVAIGLWLEHSNKFVSGEFKDNDYMAHLRALSLWSATNPSPGLRYCTHKLTSAILHAHPVDAMRLVFISKTLQGSPDEISAIALKASAITWLKEELITAHERKLQNLFSTSSALLETKSHIFPNLSSLVDDSDEELTNNLMASFAVHMAALNFLFFITAEQYANIIPPGMMTQVESEYLIPLKTAQERVLKSSGSSKDTEAPHMELELLGEQISMCLSRLHEK
ncbi:bbc5077b-5562-4aab-81b7-f77386b11f37 [Sclerotinia trifoliorum]|uniref:Bbc5077b-5562-4aab-81b7-f77386b11f37 n=1 Tax=Sclerotinia trifoliorum TaxID=28548 RepID=A0A8H2ZPF4_9HELO|nr:bbc5077b-5562-4aab-81b7-f77386b11f37 [Sclerotinia trifoliorum]